MLPKMWPFITQPDATKRPLYRGLGTKFVRKSQTPLTTHQNFYPTGNIYKIVQNYQFRLPVQTTLDIYHPHEVRRPLFAQ